jgi:hypothetical protein
MTGSVDQKAKALAESFIASQTDSAAIWRYEREQLPGLPASAICIVTVSIRHRDEDAENQRRLLDVVKAGA